MAYQTTLPRRPQAPALGASWPIGIAALLAALLVGVLLAANPGLGIAALLGLLYVPVILLNLSLGVALWVPLAFVENLPAASLGPTAVGLLVLVAWLGTLPARRRLVAATLSRNSGTAVLGALLLAWVSMSIAWAADPGAAAGEFWNWWVVAAVFAVVATSLSEPRHVVIVCVAFVVGALISVISGLVPGAAAPIEQADQGASRLAGSYGDPNFLALGLVPAMALTVGLAALRRGSHRRALLLSAATLLAFGLAASGSRGGIVAAAVATVAALLVARGRRLPIAAMAVATLAVGGLWIAASSPGNWARIRDFETGTGRSDLWTIAWRMGKDNPVAGVGLDGFVEESARYLRQPGRLKSGEVGAGLVLDRPHVAHNTYLQMFAETGLVGLGLLIGLILSTLRATWAASRSFERLGDSGLTALSRAVLIAQIGALSASIFISDYYDKRTWILLALGPALLTIASRASERARSHAG
jgi:O-antigen ligase